MQEASPHLSPYTRGAIFRPFPMHQDYPYFLHARHTMMPAVFHFDGTPEEKRCLRVVPGSHRLGPLKHDP